MSSQGPSGAFRYPLLTHTCTLASQEHNDPVTPKHKDSHTYKILSQYVKVDSMYCWLSRPTKKTWQQRVQNHHDSECLNTQFWWKQHLKWTLTANVLAFLCLYCCFAVCGCKRNQSVIVSIVNQSALITPGTILKLIYFLTKSPNNLSFKIVMSVFVMKQ